jgi:nucleoside-diphosphate-sugar epimerase
LVSGLIKLFFTERIHEPINLGNPDPTSVYDLANEIIELTESRSAIEFMVAAQDDPRDRMPDIRKANELLNWGPLVSRQEGLIQTIEDIRHRFFSELN